MASDAHEDPAFQAMCREHEIEGTAQVALCGAFWNRALASHTGEAEPVARYSFVCNAGCGVCTVKVAPFEYERTETLEGEHLGSKYQPQIVSSCCGAEVHVYDNEADHWGAEVTLGAAIASRKEAPATPSAATPAAPGEVTDAQIERMTTLAFAATNDRGEMGLQKYWYGKGVRDGAALSNPAPVAAPAQGALEKALDIRIGQGWQLGGNACPVLYTDTINGEQVRRDDLWLATTAGLKGAPAPASEAVYRVFKDGDQWCATVTGFIDIQQSTVAFADTAYRALELLTEAEGDEKRKGMRAVWGTGDSADAPVQQAGEDVVNDTMFKVYEYARLSDGIDQAEGEARHQQLATMRAKANEIRAALKAAHPGEKGGAA